MSPRDKNGGINEQQICVLLMWDKRVIEKVDDVVGEHVVSCKFQNMADGFEWVLQGCIDLLMI